LGKNKAERLQPTGSKETSVVPRHPWLENDKCIYL